MGGDGYGAAKSRTGRRTARTIGWTRLQKHLCPGCGNIIKTEGRGKQAKDVVVHVCKTCGSEDAFCCVMKKGSLPTKGMEKEKK